VSLLTVENPVTTMKLGQSRSARLHGFRAVVDVITNAPARRMAAIKSAFFPQSHEEVALDITERSRRIAGQHRLTIEVCDQRRSDGVVHRPKCGQNCLGTCVAEAARQPNDAFARLGLAKPESQLDSTTSHVPLRLSMAASSGVEDSVPLHARHVPATPAIQRVLCAGQRHRAPKQGVLEAGLFALMVSTDSIIPLWYASTSLIGCCLPLPVEGAGGSRWLSDAADGPTLLVRQDEFGSVSAEMQPVCREVKDARRPFSRHAPVRSRPDPYASSHSSRSLSRSWRPAWPRVA